MAGAMALPLQQMRQYTYRQLVICYQSWLLHQWDITSAITYRLENVQKSFSATKETKATSFTEVHPYRKTDRKKDGNILITADNMETFKKFAIGMFAR